MPRRVWVACVAGVAFIGIVVPTAVPLQAVTTITVNLQFDVIASTDGHCTLREAIIAANTNTPSGSARGECPAGDPGADLIIFQDPPGSPDVYALTIPPSGLNGPETGDLNITEDLTIIGNGPLSFFQTETIIGGGRVDRVFHIGPGISVQFERLTIRNGSVDDHGAGIANETGELFVRGSSILENRAECDFPGCFVSGAGVWNRGALTIEGSVIGVNLASCANATCTAFGGGIFNDTGGVLSLDRSVILYNDARCTGDGCFAQGGGIWNTESVTLVQSVVLNNGVECDAERGHVCDAQGGGVHNTQGTVDLNGVIRDNRAECRSSLSPQTGCRAEGGGLANHLGQMTISGTSVIGNSAKSSCPLPPCGTGGGIHNEGNLLLVESQVSSNLAGCGQGECLARGGGLFSDPFFASAAVVVSESTFSANAVVSPLFAHGGGIQNLGRLQVERSTFALNFAFVGTSKLSPASSPQVVGGGIASPGHAGIVNTTLSGNFVACWGELQCPGLSGGGGLYVPAFGSADVSFTTFVGNSAFSADPQGSELAGILSEVDSTLRIKEAIVADSTPKNCAHPSGGAPTALGANLDTDGTCPGFSIPGTNPLLGPLNLNGGPTATHALLTGSPAIDAAFNCAFVGNPGNFILVDQRNTSRPQGPACDLGSYERFRLLGGGDSTPAPPGLPRDRRATSDRTMCQMLRTFDRALRTHVRSGALAPEDAEAIREVSQRLRVGVECPGLRFPRLDTPEDRE